MIHTSRGRSKREQKLDRDKCYKGLTERKASKKARPAYQAGSMVQAQGRQLEHRALIGYLAEKYDIESDLEGETDGANDKRKTGRLQK